MLQRKEKRNRRRWRRRRHRRRRRRRFLARVRRRAFSNRTLIKSDINIAGQLATLLGCVKRRAAATRELIIFKPREKEERE